MLYSLAAIDSFVFYSLNSQFAYSRQEDCISTCNNGILVSWVKPSERHDQLMLLWCEVVVHYLHVLGAFSCSEIPPYFIKQHFPLIMQLSRAIAALNTTKIQMFMFAPSRMRNHFQVIHQSAQSMGHRFMDSLTDRSIPLLLSKLRYKGIAKYLIGIKPTWLTIAATSQWSWRGTTPIEWLNSMVSLRPHPYMYSHKYLA